jgi:DnaJ-class molecular chaperone
VEDYDPRSVKGQKKWCSANPDTRKTAQERWMYSKAAYKVLSDPAMRKEYDAGRKAWL